MSTITANFSDSGASAVAITTLALHAVSGGLIDLTSVRGAWFFPTVGRGGATARTAGMSVLIRRTISANAIGHPTAATCIGDSATATRIAMGASSNPIGTTNILTATNTGFTAGDLCFIDDTGNVGIGNSEWVRVIYVPDSTHLTLDRATQYAHSSASAHISNHADIFEPIWRDGGCKVEVLFDQGASSTGDTDVIRCLYSLYTSDSVV